MVSLIKGNGLERAGYLPAGAAGRTAECDRGRAVTGLPRGGGAALYPRGNRGTDPQGTDFSAEPPERRQARTQKFLPLYGVSVVLGLVETAAVWAVGLAGTEGAMMLLIINVIFGIVYGAYTLFWMPETLPRYYDENHVCNFAQGAFHMHIPGVYYNNRNWLHVLKAMRVWCVVSMLLTPLCTAAAVVFEQATGWQVWGAVLIGYIASLFGAIVIPAKKYQ